MGLTSGGSDSTGNAHVDLLSILSVRQHLLRHREAYSVQQPSDEVAHEFFLSEHLSALE